MSKKTPRYLALWRDAVYVVLSFDKQADKVEIRSMDGLAKFMPLISDVVLYKRRYNGGSLSGGQL